MRIPIAALLLMYTLPGTVSATIPTVTLNMASSNEASTQAIDPWIIMLGTLTGLIILVILVEVMKKVGKLS